MKSRQAILPEELFLRDPRTRGSHSEEDEIVFEPEHGQFLPTDEDEY